MAVITRDRRIQDHRAEIEAVRKNGARMVVLAADEAVDTWHQLEVLMCQWRNVEALLEQPGPFIYTITRTSLRVVPLQRIPATWPWADQLANAINTVLAMPAPT